MLDLCIPSNSTSFIVSTSKRLAQTESHLTLEFLDEALVGLSKSSELMQELCLDYIIPWLQNIGRLMGRKLEDHSLSVAKTQEIIMRLIDLMIKDTRVCIHENIFIHYNMSKWFIPFIFSSINKFKLKFGKH